MKNNLKIQQLFKIGIIGLGYVGLPLMHCFSKNKFKTIGFDNNKKIIESLNKLIDPNNQITSNQIKEIKKNSIITYNHSLLNDVSIFILTVPTPIKKNNLPDLKNIYSALKTIIPYIKKDDHIILESTVYPGVTNKLANIIEKKTKLVRNIDFFMGYSPERVNPGDPKNQVSNTNKIVASDSPKALKNIEKIYSSIIKAKVVCSNSIEEAEASKLLENVQRDINIAVMNEFAMVLKLSNLSIFNVLRLAKTKWNFINFHPGFVGGHCIGVDPYYFSYFTRKNKLNSYLTDTARKINEKFVKFFSEQIIKLYNDKFKNLKILILGLSFKPNISDTRNSKIYDLCQNLNINNNSIFVFDPLVDQKTTNINFKLIKIPKKNYYDLILIAVSHKNFKSYKFLNLIKKEGKIFDLTNNFKQFKQII